MPELRRNLGLIGAISISIAVMAPSMAVSLNPQVIAEQVGTAVPTAYVIALTSFSHDYRFICHFD